MSADKLLSGLNENQKKAATIEDRPALVLAGAGTGKTKTINARAAFLLETGVPAEKILILTFTNRSAAEIVERVKLNLGETAEGLRASTFHSWCISLIKRAPVVFGCINFSVLDTDDQLQLFKVVRGELPGTALPLAAELLEVYSFARNTRSTLGDALLKKAPHWYAQIDEIAAVMVEYESKKRKMQYLDFDDILDVVAQKVSSSPEARSYVAKQYDHILVDEFQDTNPLQWKLLDPLKDSRQPF